MRVAPDFGVEFPISLPPEWVPAAAASRLVQRRVVGHRGEQRVLAAAALQRELPEVVVTERIARAPRSTSQASRSSSRSSWPGPPAGVAGVDPDPAQLAASPGSTSAESADDRPSASASGSSNSPSTTTESVATGPPMSHRLRRRPAGPPGPAPPRRPWSRRARLRTTPNAPSSVCSTIRTPCGGRSRRGSAPRSGAFREASPLALHSDRGGRSGLRAEDDLQRLVAVVDRVGLRRVVEVHVVGDERRRVESPAASRSSTGSRWAITLACPLRRVSDLIQTIPMWSSTALGVDADRRDRARLAGQAAGHVERLRDGRPRRSRRRRRGPRSPA